MELPPGTWSHRRGPAVADPVLAGASAAIGGPRGVHGRAHRRLTPLVVVLLLTAATFVIGLAAKNPCAQGAWWHPTRQFANLCYSDLPYDYVNDGLAERVGPLSDEPGRYQPADDSPPIGVLAYAAGLITHAITGWPDVVARDDRPVAEVQADPQVRHEAVVYVGVVSVLLLLASLAAVAALVRTHRGRPWDAAAFAAAPVLALSGAISWDLLAVACVAGALWAWSRQRVTVSGALIGAGTALAFYPALLLIACGAVAIRAGRGDALARAAGSAVITWAALLLAAYPVAPGRVWVSVDGYLARGPGDGSIWQVLATLSVHPGSTLVNQVSLIVGAVLVTAVAWLAMTTSRRPRLPQVSLLISLAVVLVNKEYAPQLALWLLPLAVLARPYWRDLLIWQAGEVVYWLAIWWHLGGYTDGGSDGVDEIYVGAIAVRVAAQLWLAGIVLRDIRRPWLDPVRADAVADDPAGGVVDQMPDAVTLR